MDNYTKTYATFKARTDINTAAKLIYPELTFRMNLSIKHGGRFYDQKNHTHYIYFSVKELMQKCGMRRTQTYNGIRSLEKAGLIVRKRGIHSCRFELPEFADAGNQHHQMQKTNIIKEVIPENKNYTNTVNTKQTSQPKFKPASKTACWEDRAKKLGLTADTIGIISEFSHDYHQSAYKIAGYIKEARDVVANQYHVTKAVRRFECNENIINKLGKKLHLLLTHIVSKYDHKVSLWNYAGFLINSLKRFFTWAFGKNADVTHTSPKTIERDPREPSRKRHPIKEALPDWAKPGYKQPKLKPTSPAMCKKIQKQLKKLDEMDKELDKKNGIDPAW